MRNRVAAGGPRSQSVRRLKTVVEGLFPCSGRHNRRVFFGCGAVVPAVPRVRVFVRSGPALGSSPRSGPDGSPSRSAFWFGPNRLPQSAEFEPPRSGKTGARVWPESSRAVACSPGPRRTSQFSGLLVPRGFLRTPKRSGAYRFSVPSSPEQCRPCRSQLFARISGPRSSGALPSFSVPSSPAQSRAVPPPAALAAIRRLRAPPHPLPAGIPASVLSDIAASSPGHAAASAAAARSASSARSAPRRRAGPLAGGDLDVAALAVAQPGSSHRSVRPPRRRP